MSMQPMFTIQSSASSSFTSGKETHFLLRERSRVETSAAVRLDPVGMCDGASFWKNASP